MSDNVTRTPSSTDAFKTLIAERFSETLGRRVSKEQSWKIFKAAFAAPVEFLVASEEPARNEDGTRGDRRLPLSGVGTFVIRHGKPRQVPGKESPLVERLSEDGVPRYVFKSSERIRTFVLSSVAGVNPDGSDYVAPEVAPAVVADDTADSQSEDAAETETADEDSEDFE
jgi:hypothetical protein